MVGFDGCSFLIQASSVSKKEWNARKSGRKAERKGGRDGEGRKGNCASP